MAQTQDSSSKERSVAVAIIGAISAIIVALVAGFVALDETGHLPWQESCQVKLQLTEPTEGSRVPNGKNGVEISGKACDLNGDEGWLFDLDLGDHYYYEVYDDNPGPAVVHSGIWHFEDSPIGSPGDHNVRYIITLVDASQACSIRLQTAALIDENYKFRSFPPGCRIVDSIDVYVTYL